MFFNRVATTLLYFVAAAAFVYVPPIYELLSQVVFGMSSFPLFILSEKYQILLTAEILGFPVILIYQINLSKNQEK